MHLDLLIKGGLSNFGFIWNTINTPAGQVFTHPLTGALVWDMRAEALKSKDFLQAKELLALAYSDASCDVGEVPEEAVFEAEAHALVGSPFER